MRAIHRARLCAASSRETRYRLLFQIASQPVLIVHSNSLKVVEANPAGGQLLNKPVKRLAGRAFPELFDAEGVKAVSRILRKCARRGDEVTVRLNEGREAILGASLFRQENLVRLSPVEADTASPRAGSKLFSVVDSLPDGFVVTDLNQQIPLRWLRRRGSGDTWP